MKLLERNHVFSVVLPCTLLLPVGGGLRQTHIDLSCVIAGKRSLRTMTVPFATSHCFL
jgi:hypothetical protein